jgi:hypothetical protein
MFTFTYSAAFYFEDIEEQRGYELFFDIIVFLDLIITCFTARKSVEISESTRELFQDKRVEKVIAIKFEKTWEVNLKLITVEYIRTNFILDFLSCVPLIVT